MKLYLLDNSNNNIKALNWLGAGVTASTIGIMDGFPLADTVGDGTGTIGIRVISAGSPGGGGGQIVMGYELNGSAVQSARTLIVGGRTTNFSTFAPANTTNNAASIAIDNLTGGVLVQKIKGPPTSAQTNPAASATTFTVLASNPARRGAIIKNNSTQVLHVCFAGTATVAASSYDLPALAGTVGTVLEVPFDYTGAISGISEAGPTGNINVTELT